MAQALVTKAIQENLVMIFSKSYCPHCVRAKRILDAELGPSKYVVMELENRSDCSAIQDYLRQLTGGRTVPRVFLQGERRTCVARFEKPLLCFSLSACTALVSGKCIGGGAETAQLQKNGKLKQLLTQIGAL